MTDFLEERGHIPRMFWFLLSTSFFFITIFLHMRSVEHTRLQEKYGKERGPRIGIHLARISSLEFVFWIGLLFSPQPTLVTPILSDTTIPLANLSIPIPNLAISLPLIMVGAWFGVKGVRETGLELAENHSSPNRILNAGIYSTVRHPQYFGWIMAHIGMSVLLSARYSVLFTPILVAVIYEISRKEEDELVKEFGKEYEDYRREVPMLVPRLSSREIAM